MKSKSYDSLLSQILDEIDRLPLGGCLDVAKYEAAQSKPDVERSKLLEEAYLCHHKQMNFGRAYILYKQVLQDFAYTPAEYQNVLQQLSLATYELTRDEPPFDPFNSIFNNFKEEKVGCSQPNEVAVKSI